ncbi:MAG: methyltransferase [Pseudomonadota bacterium]
MTEAMRLLAVAAESLPEAPLRQAPAAALRARAGGAFEPGALIAEQGFRPEHDALRAEGHEVFARLPDATEPRAVALVALTRARAENRANVARAWGLTSPGGFVVVAGAKTDGVESLQKDLKALGLEVVARPGGHGRSLTIPRGEATPEAFGAWIAAAAPAVRAELADGRPAVTCAGIFSWEGADPGSVLLAQALPALKGAVADLGAGWGYLAAAALGSEAVTRVDLVEAERTALDCAQANLKDPRAVFHWADARAPGLPEGGHDAVVCNPPFHETRAAEPALGEAFIGAAARLLKPGGALWLVANRQLPYERALEARFGEVEAIGGDRRYKLIRAARPRRGGAAQAAGRGAAQAAGRGAAKAGGGGRRRR